MKPRDWLFTLITLPVDVIAWLGAYVGAYYMRAHFDILPITYVWPLRQYIQFIIILAPLFIFTMAIEGLYNYRTPKNSLGKLSSIIIACTASIMYIVLWVFFTRNLFFSRLLILYAWIASIIFIIIGRGIINLIKDIIYSKKKALRKALIIGPSEKTCDLAYPLIQHPIYGYQVDGVLGPEKPSDQKVHYMGTIDDIEKVLLRRKIDDIIVTDPDISRTKIIFLSNIAREHRATFHLTPGSLQIGSKKFVAGTIAGLPVIEILETPLEGWGNIFKRIADIIGSVLFLAIFSWLYIIIAITVKITSPGPIFYRDKRVGPNGLIYVWKFRTFKREFCTGQDYGGKEANRLEEQLIKTQNKRHGPVPKIQSDPRVTCIGAFLRRSSLDEFPQFFNVLIGQMSVIGPRPHRPKEVAGYMPLHKKLLMIKPGISGLAQVSGRSDLSFDEEADIDIYYIENWSVWLDFQIALRTIPVVLWSKGAY